MVQWKDGAIIKRRYIAKNGTTSGTHGVTNIQELTETQYNSVKTPLDASAVLESEAMDAEMSGDTSTATTKRNEATTKYNEAKTALLAL